MKGRLVDLARLGIESSITCQNNQRQ